jgi:hypothetical protein
MNDDRMRRNGMKKQVTGNKFFVLLLAFTFQLNLQLPITNAPAGLG